MSISHRTKAALIRALAVQSHAEITTLAVEVGMPGEAEGHTRHDRAATLITRLLRGHSDAEVLEKALVLGESLLLSLIPDGDWEPNASGVRLRESLELDGYTFAGHRLRPVAPGPAALGRELSALERMLEADGFDEALVHYQQAADNLELGHAEASNGQTRSFIESLVIQLCALEGERDFSDASAALQHLMNQSWIDRGEYNHLRYFWADIQDNGPHRGLSSGEEALFRFHYATAVGRYLLTKRGSAL